MRPTLKILFATALAGLTLSGWFAWQAVFTHHEPPINPATCIYAAFLVLAIGTVIALRRTQPPPERSLY